MKENLIPFFTYLFIIKKTKGTPHDPFKHYSYTGDLRAVYPLSPRREVPAHIEKRKIFLY